MDCPNCGLFNSDSALRCDCGYDLSASPEAAKQARRSQMDRRAKRLIAGIGIVVLGALALWIQVSAERGVIGPIVIILLGAATIASGYRTGPQRPDDYV